MKGIDIKPSKVTLNKSLSIVAIGASAGEIEAIKELLQNLPTTAGMSYIDIQDLSPDVESHLPELLSR